MNPAPTGSGTRVNTIGMVRVTCNKGDEPGATGGEDGVEAQAHQLGRILAGALGVTFCPATDSMRKLPDSIQPNSFSPCTNASSRARPSGSLRADW